MWNRQVDGRALRFHLAGINNQNFIMRDEQTGSWWQQISGQAIYGPLRGKQLKPVMSDELTFALWKSESPNGTVLAPMTKYQKHYETAKWEEEVGKLPVVVNVPKSQLKPRDIVIGISDPAPNGQISRAYPVSLIEQQSPIQDQVGDIPVLIALGPDKKSIRAFQRRVDGKSMNFYRATDSKDWLLVDSDTGSQWNFQGCAIAGAQRGHCLEPLPAIKDYWFDWRQYHPATDTYRRS